MARSTAPSRQASVAVLAEGVRLSVTRLARLLRHQDGGDLTPSTVSALATINRHGPLSLGDLAAREHVSAPTVTRIAEKLQRDGLVQRTISRADGRVVLVEVTAEGRSLVLDVRRRRTQWLIDHLGTLSAEELAALEQAVPVLERLITAGVLEPS